MKIERVWAMPNKWTFTIKPIKKLLEEECNGGFWIDPFAGRNSPADLTNDINPDVPAQKHEDALKFLKSIESGSADGILYDPPYSLTQAREYGRAEYSNMKYWKQCKDEIARIIRPGGKAICFGWNSMGIGKGRGFDIQRILLVPHGGSKNDTIVVVEKKREDSDIGGRR